MLTAIISAITTVIVTFLIQWYFKRPRFLYYYVYTSAAELKDPEKPPLPVHTHSIIFMNAGKTVLNNISIGHCLPLLKVNPTIYPSKIHQIVHLSDNEWEIQISKLVPKEQITVTYLYFPPITWNQINTHARSDEGEAKGLNVIPSRLLPKWVYLGFSFFAMLGVILSFYVIFLASKLYLSPLFNEVTNRLSNLIK